MRQPDSDGPTISGRDPAEGRPDLNVPGADRDDRELPDGPGTDLPERLGDRVEHGPGSGIASGEPDLVPDVQVPDETM